MPASDHKRRLTAFVVAMAVLIATPLAVVATTQFTDVPTSSVHHDNIDWLKNAGVTSGCNPPDNDEYCPTESVTRAQMATFMRNLAENQVVDAATAIEAETAGDADTLQGQGPADLSSHVLLAHLDGFMSLTGGDTTEVLTLELPPGAYLVSANATVNNNAATNEGVSCTLAAGAESVETGSSGSEFELYASNGPGDRESWTLQLITDLAATDTASISCTTSGGWSGNIIQPQITALSVQSTSATVLGTTSGGDDEG